MIKLHEQVKLRDLLFPTEVYAQIDPEKQYKQITVKLWGKGVKLRNNITGVDIGTSRQFIAKSNQFILSKIDARNGAFGLVPEFLDGAIVSQDFPVFSLDLTKIFPKYLDWLSKTEYFINLCTLASEGTTNRIRLKINKFLSSQIPLPPLSEQQRIVARIEELAAKIEEATSTIEDTEKETQELLFSVYHSITKDVQWLPMRDIAPLTRRPVTVDLDKEYYEIGIRSFGKGAFHKPKVTGADLGQKRVFQIQENDLLFNIVFAWEGAVAVARLEDNERIGSHRFLTCVPKEGIAVAPFLCSHFLTPNGLEQLMAASPGGAGRNRTLGIEAMHNIKVPLPSYDKQQWFASLKKQVDAARLIREKKKTELNALLPSILDKAFKGEL